MLPNSLISINGNGICTISSIIIICNTNNPHFWGRHVKHVLSDTLFQLLQTQSNDMRGQSVSLSTFEKLIVWGWVVLLAPNPATYQSPSLHLVRKMRKARAHPNWVIFPFFDHTMVHSTNSMLVETYQNAHVFEFVLQHKQLKSI